MKKVIIGVHGLGNKPSKSLLQKWWSDAMLEGLNLININKDLPDFEMIYWADILHEKPLNQGISDKKDQAFLHEPYRKAPKKYVLDSHSIRKRVVDFVTGQLNKIFLNEDNTLNYSFISEGIIKKYFKDLDAYYIKECKDQNNVSCKVRDLTRDRVVQVIKKYKNREIMIIAHSMGSIITFDVLNFLIPKIKIHTLVTIGSPLGFPFVVGKIAAEQKITPNRKSVMSTPQGITDKWYNFADIMDYVALDYKLADNFTKNDKGVLPKDCLVNNNYEINGIKNPHKSFGYLRTPEFSKSLSDFIGEEKLNIGQKVLCRLKKLIQYFSINN